MRESPSQQSLPFPARRLASTPFIEGAANEEALARLTAWRSGLGGGRPLSVVIAISGAPAIGKSAFLAEAARRLGTVPRGPETDFEALMADALPAVAVDDVHLMAPLDLFALIEGAASRRLPLLLAGRAPLIGWAGEGRDYLPDLVNRLRSIAHIEIGAPDEAMLARYLSAELRAKGLKLPEGAVASAASKLRREWAAAKGFAETVERLAAAGYKKPGPLLRDALAEAGAFTL
jgi:hypothetical protein